MAESMGESEGNWWGGWLQSAKEKSLAAVDFVKRDLTEFTNTMTNDTSKIVEVTSSTIKETLTTENTSVAKDKVKQGINTLFSGLSKALIVPHEDYSPKAKHASEGAPIFDRSKVRLHAIQVDPGTYLNKPSGPPGLFQDWVAGFKIDEKKGDISEVLVVNVEVRALYTKLVPSELSHAEFWQRYFYKLHQLEMDEIRKQAMMTRAERDREDSLGWDDDWSGDEDFVDLSNTDLTPDSERTASDLKQSECNTARLPSSVLSPIPERGKETTPLNESQPRIQSDEGHIKMKVSTPCDKLPCDQQHTSVQKQQESHLSASTDIKQEHFVSNTDSEQKLSSDIKQALSNHIPTVQEKGSDSAVKEKGLDSAVQVKGSDSTAVQEKGSDSTVQVKGSNSTALEMKESDSTAVQMKGSDSTQLEMKKSNSTAVQMKGSDSTDMEMKESDSTAVQMKGSDSTPLEMKESNSTAVQMNGSDSTDMEMKGLNSTVEQVKGLEQMDVNAFNITSTDGSISAQTILHLKKASDPVEHNETISFNPKLSEDESKENMLTENTNNNIHSPSTDIITLTTEMSQKSTVVPQKTPKAEEGPVMNPETSKDTPAQRTVDTDFPASVDSRTMTTSKDEEQACALMGTAIDIKTKIKGDMVLVGSDRESPNSDSSGTKDPSTEEDWEHDFDLEVTEEDLKAADEIAKNLGTDLDLQDDDWENWE